MPSCQLNPCWNPASVSTLKKPVKPTVTSQYCHSLRLRLHKGRAQIWATM
jgi:hypothetical protein